jgi:hypothetical protein
MVRKRWVAHEKHKVKILEIGRIVDNIMIPDKNFKPHEMMINSYNDEEYPELDGLEYDPNLAMNTEKGMKRLFINPVPKKLKFTEETIKGVKLGTLNELMDIQNGQEAYLEAYSEIEFLRYRYNKINGFYPDLLIIQNIKSEKFIQGLFKYAKPPKDSYLKSLGDDRGKIGLNNIIIAFRPDDKDDIILHLDENEAIILYNKEYEKRSDSLLHLLVGLLKGCIYPVITKNKIYVVYSTQHGFDKIGFTVKKVNVNIEENYNDGFPEVAKEIIEGLNSKKKTNLVILSGDPGTGKTTFIRYLTSKIKKNIIFISPDMVNEITNPAFIPFLIKNNDTVLIIEDAEPALQSRDGNGRTGAVSNVLNLTDGLLSDCLNISIVATFNTSGKDIDKALLRKGRLLKNYKFEKLAVEKSKLLLAKLGHKEIEVKEPMTLSDIYFYGSDNNTQEFKTKKIGFGK